MNERILDVAESLRDLRHYLRNDAETGLLEELDDAIGELEAIAKVESSQFPALQQCLAVLDKSLMRFPQILELINRFLE